MFRNSIINALKNALLHNCGFHYLINENIYCCKFNLNIFFNGIDIMTNFEIPDEFCKVLKDFVRDIKTTFPEYTELIHKWWKDEDYFYYIEDESERKAAVDKYQDTSIRIVFDFVKKKISSTIF